MVHLRRVPRLRQLTAGVGALMLSLVLSACSTLGAEPALQITPMGTTGSYLLVLDNCPALREISLLSVPDGAAAAPLWRIVRDSPPANVANVEVQLGQVPNGWIDEQPFTAALDSGQTYRIDIAPGNRTLDFDLADVDSLARGQAITDRGNTELARADVSVPCDGDAAWGNLWRQGAVFFIGGLLALLLIGTALAKALSVLVANRSDSYDEYEYYDDDPHFDGEYEDFENYEYDEYDEDRYE